MTNNNNVYIPPHKPLSCKYLLPDEYDEIISLNDLSILHVNCRSMHNFRNFNNLILYLKLFAQSFAIIAITETWLLDNDALQSYEINNYKLFTKNKKNTNRGGGIALYIHANIIQYFDREIIFNYSHFESLTLYFFNMSIGNIIISVIHRTPDNRYKNSVELNEEFNKYLTDICKSQNNYNICAGDFNIDLLKYAEHTPTTEFINLLFSCNLFPLISKPIRITNTSTTLIDNIYVTNNLTATHANILYAEILDHFPIYAIFPLSINTPREHNILYRDMSSKNRNSLYIAVLITDW